MDRRVQVKEIKGREIEEIINFIEKINKKGINSNTKLGNATEGNLDIDGWIDVMAKRKHFLKTILKQERYNNDLREICSILVSLLEQSIKEIELKKGEEYWANSQTVKVISPSDMGIHNMIRSKDGIIFFDFEYAGIDDITKTLSDLLMNPRYHIGIKERKYLIDLANNKIGGKHVWERRLEDIEVINHIKWCSIIIKNIEKKNVINGPTTCTLKQYIKKWGIIDYN